MGDIKGDAARDADELAIRVARHVANVDGVVAVAQGGSSVRKASGEDALSDIDLYAFVRAPLQLSSRAQLARELGVVERDNLVVDYWGASDQWVDAKTGRHVDLMYFEAAWILEEIENALDRHRAKLGYTTSFCYTIAHARPLCDPHGWLDKIQRRCREPYPAQLRKNIVAANRRAMRGILSSYEVQIRKAVARNDLVSINHRIAALVASYFDILFAVNEQLHPGEKRLIALAQTLCPARPPSMESDLAAVLAGCAPDIDVTNAVARLLDNLDAFLELTQH